jgi:hypothetical protein
MAFTNASNPIFYPPESINPVGPYFIDSDWCIGDSLRYINENNRIFDQRTIELSTLFLEISSFSVSLSARDTRTIDFDYNFKANTLSANVVDNSIGTAKLGVDITQPGKDLIKSACLSALHDVDLAGLTDQQTLVWNELGQYWQNKDVIGGNFSPGSTTDYGDISIVISETGNMTWNVDALAITNGKIAEGTIEYNRLKNNISTTTPIFWWDANRIGIGTVTPTARLFVTSTGTTYTNAIENNTASIVAVNTTTNNANAHALLALQANGAGGGDAFVSYRINGGQLWSTGIDNVDSDKFKIANDGNSVSTNTRLTITPEGKVGIGTTNPNSEATLHVIGTIMAPTLSSGSGGFVGGPAALASDIAGGSAGSIVYQTDENQTSFLPLGDTNDILVSQGANTAPTWKSTADFAVGTAANADNATTVTDGVYLTPAQTIIGQKTFSSKIIANGRIQSTILDGTYISGFKGGSGITFNSKGNTGVDSSWFGWASQETFSGGFNVGTISDTFQIRWAPTGNISANTNNTDEIAKFDKDGNFGFKGSLTSGSVSWTRLVDIPPAFSNGGEGTFVNTTSDQSVAGVKSFTSNFKPKRIGFVYEDWSEVGDGGATIVNSNQWGAVDGGTINYGALMLVGNRARGNGTGSRFVQLWDNVEIPNGALTCSGDITAFASDKRLKENITLITNALEKVNSLQGFTYNYNELGQSFNFDKNKKHAGVFAQEIEKVLPEAVDLAPFDTLSNGTEKTSKTGENYLTVKYDKLVPLLIEAIKELSQEVKELKSKIKE